MTRLIDHRYAFGPIELACVARGLETPAEMARLLETDYRNIYRWRERGVGFWQADRLAVAVGSHPAVLWPAWRDDSVNASEADGDVREGKRQHYLRSKAHAAA